MTDASLDRVRELREKAERARYHAALVDDQKAKADLIKYAEQLEADALELTSRCVPNSHNPETAAWVIRGHSCQGSRMSDLDGDLNQSSQHFTFETEVECDETTTEAAFLYGGGER